MVKLTFEDKLDAKERAFRRDMEHIDEWNARKIGKPVRVRITICPYCGAIKERVNEHIQFKHPDSPKVY